MNPYDALMEVKGFEATKILLLHHEVESRLSLPSYVATKPKRLLGMVTKGLWYGRYPQPGNDGIIYQYVEGGGTICQAQWSHANDYLFNFLPDRQDVRYVFAPKALLAMITDEFEAKPAYFDILATKLNLSFVTINKKKHVLVPADEFRVHFSEEWNNRMFILLDHWFHSRGPYDRSLITETGDAIEVCSSVCIDPLMSLCLDVRNAR